MPYEQIYIFEISNTQNTKFAVSRSHSNGLLKYVPSRARSNNGSVVKMKMHKHIPAAKENSTMVIIKKTMRTCQCHNDRTSAIQEDPTIRLAEVEVGLRAKAQSDSLQR